MPTKIEKAISWMEETAENSSHGYDQIYRWGEKGDYDCSSAVITAWENAGVPVKTNGATYTGNMYDVFIACGFDDVTKLVDLYTGSGLIRGDVLLNIQKHTAMYCGNGYEVEASINEKGTSTGGKPGDQTEKEFKIRTYRNFPWDVVLRYSNSTNLSTKKTVIQNTYLKKGCVGDDVKEMQTMLIELGYACGSTGADGDFGSNTYKALIKFQTDYNLEVDGIYGKQSKAKMIEAYNKLSKSNTDNTKLQYAQFFDKSLSGIYKVKASSLNLRYGAGKETTSITIMKKSSKVNCYGYYSISSDGVKWLYVVYKGITGFASSKYLKKT